MNPILCQACACKPKESGCDVCGGFGVVFVTISCEKCDRTGLVRPDAFTSYEGKKWRTVDGLTMFEHMTGRLCEYCEENK